MKDDVSVRRYELRDRAAVREICCDTAQAGEPVDSFFPDREVFADFLTRYYTDIAPEASWVAEQNGQVVGYVLGCFDTRRFMRAMIWRIGPRGFLRALFRGTLWHPQTLRLVRANLNKPKVDFHRSAVFSEYPGHLHINLRRSFRGHGAGRILLESFLNQAARAGVPGMHAGVSDANEKGRKFFELSGFAALGKENRVRKPDQPESAAFTIIYGKRLESGKLS